MKVDLTAVQVEINPEDYTSEKSFFNSMNLYMDKATPLWNGQEHMVVFPEFFPTLLYPGLFNSKHLSNTSVARNLLSFVLENFSVGKTLNFIRGSFLNKALEVEKIYMHTFSELANKNKCYITAPSILLPDIDIESAKGRYIESKRLFNISYLFSPKGKIIKIFKKKKLTSSENKILFSPAEKYQRNFVELSGWKFGAAICYDMFFESNMAELDAAGVNIIAVPSCNFGLWKRKTSYRPEFTQEQVWYKDGPYSATLSRENIRYLINSMAVGKVGTDTAQGRSSIWSNGRVMKMSRSWDSADVINLTVDL